MAGLGAARLPDDFFAGAGLAAALDALEKEGLEEEAVVDFFFFSFSTGAGPSSKRSSKSKPDALGFGFGLVPMPGPNELGLEEPKRSSSCERGERKVNNKWMFVVRISSCAFFSRARGFVGNESGYFSI